MSKKKLDDMVNFMCPLDWAIGCPAIWLNIKQIKHLKRRPITIILLEENMGESFMILILATMSWI